MAYSSILGADKAPSQPRGRDADALGPSDNSDSGSDAVGTYESHADSDAVGTGERGSVTPGEGREGGDILPDQIISMDADGDIPSTDALDAADLANLDAGEDEADAADDAA